MQQDPEESLLLPHRKLIKEKLFSWSLLEDNN